jgi:hypothetical protein
LIKINPYRIEKEIEVTYDREYSDRIPNVAQLFRFEDDEGKKYNWDTTTDPEGVGTGQNWIVRMTVIGKECCLDVDYLIVNRVKFVKRLLKEENI